MKRPARIHILGASGSGTTTLGAALAYELNLLHVDADDYYWQPSDPPFQFKNEPAHRVSAIREIIGGKNEWVLSGSIVSWGNAFTKEITCAILLDLGPVERINRLRKREKKLYGGRISPGGDMHDNHLSFMKWAQAYDTTTTGVRCRQVHIEWVEKLHCPVISLDSSKPVNQLITEATCGIK